MTNVLDIAVKDRIAVVTMTRPGKRNAMNETLLAALEAFFLHHRTACVLLS